MGRRDFAMSSWYPLSQQPTGFGIFHDDVIKWKHFPRYWPFVRGIHRSPVNSPQRPVSRNFDVFLDLRLNKRLNKQSWGWRFETTSRSLWRHSNALTAYRPQARKKECRKIILIRVQKNQLIQLFNRETICQSFINKANGRKINAVYYELSHYPLWHNNKQMMLVNIGLNNGLALAAMIAHELDFNCNPLTCQLGSKPLREPMLTHIWSFKFFKNKISIFKNKIRPFQIEKSIWNGLPGSMEKPGIACAQWMDQHLVRVTYICVGKLTTIGSDNGLSPGRRQAIIWTNAGILLIAPLGINFSEILIAIQAFSLKKTRLKFSSEKRCPFHVGLNVIT